MEPAQDRQWHERLEANRRQLAQLARAFEEGAGLNRPSAEALTDGLIHQGDELDIAQALSERETSDSLIHLLGENREQVEHALERLADGKYGYCEDCSGAIPPDRLAFRPESTRCVDCQARWDRLHSRRSA